MKILQLSKRTGVSQRMLRHFEQLGLLSPERTATEHRKYKESDLDRVLRIREMQRLGLTLREIGSIFSDPESADEIFGEVFIREREKFFEKQGVLRDLRERLTGAKYPYFEKRIAYSIPGMVDVVSEMESNGWRNFDFTYMRFAEWQGEIQVQMAMVGEMIWQSAFYLIVAEDENMKPSF